ncbi:MAG: dienelactone hydrolase [Actinobacteria bacterium]|nr:dienelactone hydrolase [Actinomycetota bacterium]
MTATTDIEWPGGVVTGVVAGQGGTGILLAHGAGTSQQHPAMQGLRDGLAAGGHTVMTFNYPYAERGARRPDPEERLLACHRAAADHLRDRVETLFLAGRSMGGRMGTYLVADGYRARGLVLYAYPLHPAGRPDRLRIEQFGEIAVPMLFFQGSNDALSRMDLFEEHIAALPDAEVEILDGAGHGPRGGGWSQETMTDRYVTGTLRWIEGLSSGEDGDSPP